MRSKWLLRTCSFVIGLVFVGVSYLAYLKVADMYDLITLPDVNVHAYCMGVRRWGADEVCHCYEIHGRPCYGDRAMGSDVYKQELIRDGR